MKKLKTCVRIFSHKKIENKPYACGIKYSGIVKAWDSCLLILRKIPPNIDLLYSPILSLVEINAQYNNKSSCIAPIKVFSIQTRSFGNLGIMGNGDSVALIHCSQISTSVTWPKFVFPGKHFDLLENFYRHLKLY